MTVLFKKRWSEQAGLSEDSTLEQRAETKKKL